MAMTYVGRIFWGGRSLSCGTAKCSDLHVYQMAGEKEACEQWGYRDVGRGA